MKNLHAILGILAGAALLGFLAGRIRKEPVQVATVQRAFVNQPPDTGLAALEQAEAETRKLREEVEAARAKAPPEMNRSEKQRFAKDFVAQIDESVTLRDFCARLDLLDEEMATVFLQEMNARKGLQPRREMMMLVFECGGPDANRLLNEVVFSEEDISLTNGRAEDIQRVGEVLAEVARSPYFRFPRLHLDDAMGAAAVAKSKSPDAKERRLACLLLAWWDTDASRERLRLLFETDADTTVSRCALLGLANIPTRESHHWLAEWEYRSKPTGELLAYLNVAKGILERRLSRVP